MSILKGQPQTVNYLEFDGVNDYVNMGTLGNWASQNLTDFKIEFIAENLGSGSIFAINNDNSQITRFNSEINPYGMSLFHRDVNAATNFSRWNFDLTTKKTYRLEFNGGSSSFYVDNVLQSKTVISSGSPSNFNNFQYDALIFARNQSSGPSGFLSGKLYDWKMYSGNTLFLHYDMSEGSGTTLTDLSGNNNDGTIVGATWDSEQVLPEIQNIYKGTNEISKVFKGNTLVFQSVAYIVATGGTTTTYEDNGTFYKSHTFTSSGNFVVNSLGNQSNDLDYLIVAGGAGGSNANGSGGGGGGAGGYRTTNGTSGGNSSAESKITATAQSYTIIVGGGGAGGVSNNEFGTNGVNSSALGITSTGGGGGAGFTNQGLSGGSGGGGGPFSGTSGIGTINQGTNGGAGASNGAGGGGGAEQTGQNASGNNGGNGGNGLSNTLRTGNTETRAGGGGGGVRDATPGSGGSGGGGNGGGGSVVPTVSPGLPNTGGGGGGDRSNGEPGGSGIVIIRYEVGEL